MFFLFPRLEHPAGWICARYKSLLLLLLLLIQFPQQRKFSMRPFSQITYIDWCIGPYVYGKAYRISNWLV